MTKRALASGKVIDGVAKVSPRELEAIFAKGCQHSLVTLVYKTPYARLPLKAVCKSCGQEWTQSEWAYEHGCGVLRNSVFNYEVVNK